MSNPKSQRNPLGKSIATPVGLAVMVGKMVGATVATPALGISVGKIVFSDTGGVELDGDATDGELSDGAGLRVGSNPVGDVVIIGVKVSTEGRRMVGCGEIVGLRNPLGELEIVGSSVSLEGCSAFGGPDPEIGDGSGEIVGSFPDRELGCGDTVGS